MGKMKNYKRLYIAYGSNINLEQMARRCPHSKVVGTAMLPDYELEFRRVATIVPSKGKEVPVLLWEIDRIDEMSLDRYEGYPHLYRKEMFDADMNGFKCKGMGYIMNYGEIEPPSPQYYSGILAGYRANGLDTSYLEAALDNSLEAFRRQIVFSSDDDYIAQQEDDEEQEIQQTMLE